MLAVIGLVVGIVLALVLRPELPVWLQPYLPIMIVAALDALVGAARASLEQTFFRSGVCGFVYLQCGHCGADRLAG